MGSQDNGASKIFGSERFWKRLPGNREPSALGTHVGLKRARWAPRIIVLQHFSDPNDFGSEPRRNIEPSALWAHVGLERPRRVPRITALQKFSGSNDFGSELPGSRGPSALGAHVGPDGCRWVSRIVALQKMSARAMLEASPLGTLRRVRSGPMRALSVADGLPR